MVSDHNLITPCNSGGFRATLKANWWRREKILPWRWIFGLVLFDLFLHLIAKAEAVKICSAWQSNDEPVRIQCWQSKNLYQCQLIV